MANELRCPRAEIASIGTTVFSAAAHADIVARRTLLKKANSYRTLGDWFSRGTHPFREGV